VFFRAAHNKGMPPEDPAQPAPHSRPDSLEEAIDAIVYDVHPVLVRKPVYPYAAPSGASEGGAPRELTVWSFVADSLGDGLAGVMHHFAQDPDYVVPQRFGMSAILGMMTVVAILFGGLHWADAEPGYYVFFAILAIATCIVQMFNGQRPRLASSVVGAVLLPLFAVGAAAYIPSISSGEFIVVVFFSILVGIPAGALLGYITGTCAAGIFLVMDALEPYLQGRRPVRQAGSSSPAAGA
jgi:hypothetical protein